MSSVNKKPSDSKVSSEASIESTIDGQCDSFHELLNNGEVSGLQEWIERQPIKPSADLLKKLVRVDIEFQSAQKSEFDVTDYIAGLAFDWSVSASIPRAGLLVGHVESAPKQLTKLGQFRIEKEIGRGGFGIVFLAFDEVLNRQVALKIPRGPIDTDAKRRFLREAEASAKLDHPAIVPVFEAGEIDDECFIAAAYCPGETLAEWRQKDENSNPTVVAQVVRDLAQGIAHAHARGVIHRDLKPGNVLMHHADDSTGPKPRIADFGLAKLIQHRLEDTHSSVLLGTPCYMAPELLLDQSAIRPELADLYALGVILYELLTGRRPYEGQTILGVLDSIRAGGYRSPREINADVPLGLDAICVKCLDHCPIDRYQSGEELATDLDLYLQGHLPNAQQAGFVRKAIHWGMSPKRIYEAGALSIFLGLVTPLWIMGMIWLASVEKLDTQLQKELIPQAAAVIGLLLAPTTVAGYKTLKGSRFWRRYGFVASVFNVAAVMPPLFGYVVVFPELYAKYPLGKIVAYTFLTLAFSIQLLQYTLLLWSETKQDVRPATVI